MKNISFIKLIKNKILKILYILLSKLNSENKRDFLEKLEYLITIANGKHRGGYDLNFKVKIVNRLLRNITQKGTIVDVGANYGKYTENILKLFPKDNFILFEPQKKIFEEIKKKFVDREDVKVFNYGLYSKNTKQKIYINKSNHGLASIYNRQHEINEHIKFNFFKSSLISLERFNELKLKINYIKIIKIDVEGAELEVLKGFGNYLKKTKLILKNFFLLIQMDIILKKELGLYQT